MNLHFLFLLYLRLNLLGLRETSFILVRCIGGRIRFIILIFKLVVEAKLLDGSQGHSLLDWGDVLHLQGIEVA